MKFLLIPSKCGSKNILYEIPSNKIYCFDDYIIPFFNYNEEFLENYISVEIKLNEENIDFEYDDEDGGYIVININEDEEEKIKGLGYFIIKRNDDDKIIFKKEIDLLLFNLLLIHNYLVYYQNKIYGLNSKQIVFLIN